jgi:hypothetical protein
LAPTHLDGTDHRATFNTAPLCKKFGLGPGEFWVCKNLVDQLPNRSNNSSALQLLRSIAGWPINVGTAFSAPVWASWIACIVMVCSPGSALRHREMSDRALVATSLASLRFPDSQPQGGPPVSGKARYPPLLCKGESQKVPGRLGTLDCLA